MASFEAVLLDLSGAIVFATPQAQAMGLPAALSKEKLGGESRLSALEIDGSNFVVLTVPLQDSTLVLVRPDVGEGALVEFLLAVDCAFDILDHFLTNPYEGVTVVDSNSILRYISPVHERFFGLKRGESIGRPVQEVIENTRLHVVAKTGVPEIGQVQQMRGVSRVVNRLPIRHRGELVGAIGQVMFKEPEEVHQLSRQIHSLRAEVDYYKKELVGLQHRTFGLNEIIGESAPIRKLKDEIRKVAVFDVPVFISGESGTGKELIAHAIHNLSPRQNHSMVLINCGSLPETLVESELFGYDSGAFTGARREGRAGKFEMAHQSSLFLDEIGDMPLATQVKLLRVLETGAFERIGGNRERTTNFRLISATNKDLRRQIMEEKFRADLFFRINGVTLYVPPLRDRADDIPLLVEHFVKRLARRLGSDVRRVHPSAMDMLQALPWYGNVRQLHNAVQRAMIFANGAELAPEDFREIEDLDVDAHAPPSAATGSGSNIRDKIDRMESALIKEALERHGGNKKRVAEELGISRSYLYKKLAEIEHSPG